MSVATIMPGMDSRLGMKLTFVCFLLAMIAGACSTSDEPGGSRSVTVFTAASATDVIEEAALRFEAQFGTHVSINADASSSLARQILAGAPADVFLSANQVWMDELVRAGAVNADSRTSLLANQLVIIVPHGRDFDVEMTPMLDGMRMPPGVTRIAVADPDHVPAGQYARQALQSLGWWEAWSPLLIPTKDVRAALRLVELGEADAGIVYETDARRSQHVDVMAIFPRASHDAIEYPIALCTDSPDAVAFIAFLHSEEMRAVFEAAGFSVVQSSGTEDH